uniref:DJ-1/PfpI domain-containing protein n=1 Tax=Globisporangium ultimum (strain ATCC 200006 / CBS 805.95 / DAOM BR144) TaxID=431595 RepID=K3X6B2_GLOUD
MATTHAHPTALIPIADGSEEIEAITLADVLVRGGVKVTLASVGKKSENIVTMSRGVKVQADLAIEACVDLQFDLIVVPGGQPGANHLRDCSLLIELLRQQKHEDKLYGAICAAPAVVLHSHGLLASPATGYTGFEKQVTDVAHSSDRVVVAGNCITSQGPGTAMEMGVKLVELLSGKDKAAEVAKALLMP